MAGARIDDDHLAVQRSGQGGEDRGEIRRADQQQQRPTLQLHGERGSFVRQLVGGGGRRPGVGRPQSDPHGERTVLGQGLGDGGVHRFRRCGSDEDPQFAGAGRSVLPGQEVFPRLYSGHVGRGPGQDGAGGIQDYALDTAARQRAAPRTVLGDGHGGPERSRSGAVAADQSGQYDGPARPMMGIDERPHFL